MCERPRERAIKDLDQAVVIETVEQLLNTSTESSLFSSPAKSAVSEKESSSDEDDILSPSSLRLYLEGTRYLAARERIPQSRDFVQNILPRYPDRQFRQHMRMSKEGFNTVFRLIKDHPIFTNNSWNRQADPMFQLFVCLYRFGFHGNAAGHAPVAGHCGIGHGTVNLYTARVTYALLSHESSIVKWPDAPERSEIGRRIRNQHGFPFCVGFLDGTIVPLYQKPPIEAAEAYYHRKHGYGLNATIICDDRKRIRYVMCGYTASCHDSRVYSNSKPAINPANYFANDEYVLADSAYALSTTVITPYKAPLSLINDNKQLNTSHSKCRVKVENTIGMVKNRFQSLKGLRVDIRCDTDHARCNYWIRVCCILHNLLLDDYYDPEWGDIDKEAANDEDDDDRERLAVDAAGMNERAKGEAKRERLKTFLIDFNAS